MWCLSSHGVLLEIETEINEEVVEFKGPTRLNENSNGRRHFACVSINSQYSICVTLEHRDQITVDVRQS